MVNHEPKPRQEAFDIYWRFAAERQSVFLKRAAGKEGPWTDDPILQEYKFCNVYRASDRVSQYMIRDVCYSKEKAEAADRIFQIVAFRTFSRPSTWEFLKSALGRAPIIEDLEDGSLVTLLDQARDKKQTLYTGAFILCATDAYGHGIKHRNHLALFHDMFVENNLAGDIQDAESLSDVYDLLHEYPLMGDFMSYQTAIDLNYSGEVNFSEDDFTHPGPGAVRGMSKAFLDTSDMSASEIIMWMVDNQDEHFERLGLDFKGLWGRRLHAIDCQGLFCELDKYTRVALPHLPSNRKRIKARFEPDPRPISYFFPPKWNITPSPRPVVRSRA